VKAHAKQAVPATPSKVPQAQQPDRKAPEQALVDLEFNRAAALEKKLRASTFAIRARRGSADRGEHQRPDPPVRSKENEL